MWAEAFTAARVSSLLSARPRQRTVERIREGGLLARPERSVSARLHADAAQSFHEVPHGQSLADGFGRVFLASRVDDDDALVHERRREWDIGGHRDVAFRGVLRDVA